MRAASMLQATLQTMNRGESWKDQYPYLEGHGLPNNGKVFL